MDYDRIKESDEYKELISMGYHDKTTPIQIKNGSLDFTKDPNDLACEHRYTIYGDKVKNINSRKIHIGGAIRRYSASYNWKTRKFDSVKQSKVAEFPIITYDDYIIAIKKVIKTADDRENKYWKKLNGNPYDAITVCFETRVRSIKDIYDRMNR